MWEKLRQQQNSSFSLASWRMELEVRIVLRKVDLVVQMETTLAFSNGRMLLELRTLRVKTSYRICYYRYGGNLLEL